MTSLMTKALGCIVAVTGVAVLVSGFRSRNSAKQELQWDSTQGVIESSTIKWDGRLYVPVIKYNYEIAGRRFEGTEVRTGLVCYNWRGPAERICEQYFVGAQVPVFVDRHDHSIAVLEAGGDRKYLPLLAAIGFFLSVVGLALVAS
jgi:hypothetical protein